MSNQETLKKLILKSRFRLQESKKINEANSVGDKVTADGRPAIIQFIDDEDGTALVKFTDGESPKKSVMRLRDLYDMSTEEEAPQEEAPAEEPEEEDNSLGGKYADAIEQIQASDDKIQTAFDILVPDSGYADSKAGELVRAMMRILYRDYNDGDKFYEGYGLETCGPSAAFIATEVPGTHDKMIRIAERNLGDNDGYTEAIKEISDMVIQHIVDNPNLLDERNEFDSRDMDAEMIEELEPEYDYDCEIPSSIHAHLNAGNISRREFQENLSYWEIIPSDADVNVSTYYINITGINREEFEELENSFYEELEKYGEELDEEYGDPEGEDDEDYDDEDYDDEDEE